MTRGASGEPTPSWLVDYFLEGAKPREAWLLGLEIEKMGVDAGNGLPLPYDGAAASVRAVLEAYLARCGGEPLLEDGRLVGLHGERGSLSLEPGGQVEWSSRPAPTLEALADDARFHLDAMSEVGRSLGVRWLDVAVHPDLPADEMPWVPKERYRLMRHHLGARGALAHRMMTQTSSTQCTFDFDGPEDWARKFRVAALLSPVAVALFANSSRVDGRESGFRSFREAIWRDTDPDRTGLPDVAFRPGFGLEAWVEWLLDVPTMFVDRDGKLEPTGGTPFRALVARRGLDRQVEKDWELHLSCIFTEVRSYTYLEVRSADMQPDPLVVDVPTFWTGLLYHADSLRDSLEAFAGHDDPTSWLDAMRSAARLGLEGRAGGRPIGELAASALGLSLRGLREGAACVGDAPSAAGRIEALADRLGIEPRV